MVPAQDEARFTPAADSGFPVPPGLKELGELQTVTGFNVLGHFKRHTGGFHLFQVFITCHLSADSEMWQRSPVNKACSYIQSR